MRYGSRRRTRRNYGGDYGGYHRYNRRRYQKHLQLRLRSPQTTTLSRQRQGFTYKLAIFSDPTTDNPWAYFDTEADVWNQYVLSPIHPGSVHVVVPELHAGAFYGS